MGGTTADKGYPYPSGTDRVMDGDNAMQALAQSVDYSIQAGAQQITTAIDTNMQVQVTFARPYTAPPVVALGPYAGPTAGSYSQLFWVASLTSTGFLLTVKRGGNVATVTCGWVAVGRPT